VRPKVIEEPVIEDKRKYSLPSDMSDDDSDKMATISPLPQLSNFFQGETTKKAKAFVPKNTTEEYMIGRKEYEEELEWLLGTTPFEEYPIFKADSLISEDFSRIGYFKGIVRVYEDILKGEDREKPEKFGLTDPIQLDMRELSVPHSVIVRVYILKGYNIPAKDDDKNTSDPYLTVKLGKMHLSDRANHLNNQIKDVKFLKYFELETKFPGSSKLEISLFDYESIGKDNLIGATVIDLEDRWFSEVWRKGEPWKIKNKGENEDFTNEEQVALDRFINSPTEVRPLWHPSRSQQQGSLKLWIDILHLADARNVPPIDITPLPRKNYELRIIIYRCRNWEKVGDIMTSMTDLFIKMKFEKDENWLSTDIHYRAETTMSFNWRMKFDVKLPIDYDKEGELDLKMQMCDFDILFNDILDEKKLNLREYFSRANEVDEPLQFFPAENSGKALLFEEHMANFCSEFDASHVIRESVYDDVSVNRDVEVGNKKRGMISENTSLVHRKSVYGSNSMKQSYGTDSEGSMVRPKATKKKISMWSKIKEGLGFGPDPPFSGWIKLENVGEVCMGIEIIPEKYVAKLPAGDGRSAPNSNPELPEPEGRLDPSRMINPLYALKTCFGNGILMRLTGAICFILFIAAIVFLGPTISSSLVIAEDIPFGDYLIPLGMVVLICGMIHSVKRCCAECGCSGDDSDDDFPEMDDDTLPHMD